jgi:hypothetical protein
LNTPLATLAGARETSRSLRNQNASGGKMRIVAVVCVAASVGACASITRGTDEQVGFHSEPAGAEVRTSTGLACPSTPCTIAVPRKDQFVATFTKAGYHPQQVMVGTKVGGGGALGLAGNALVGGVVGIVVDASTGAGMDHEPNPVIAQLKPLGSVSPLIENRPRRKRAPPVS